MSLEARKHRKIRRMLFRNVILANRRPKPPRTKREILNSFIRSVAMPNSGVKETLKRLGVTFLTEEQFRKLIEYGEIEPYELDEK